MYPAQLMNIISESNAKLMNEWNKKSTANGKDFLFSVDFS